MWETKTENIWLESSLDAQPLAVYVVTCPQVKPRAILQIVHGMAEHWTRYTAFASFLAQQGYVVCGHDQLGHGATSEKRGADGFFAPKNGREYLLADIHRVTAYIQQQYPGLPVILFGHSMGSFLARLATVRWPQAQLAAVYCGTGGTNPAAPAGIALTGMLCRLHGPEWRSRAVDRMVFGGYQKRIRTPQTAFDWLSVNTKNVADYEKDPKCGFLFTVSAFHELMCMTQEANGKAWFEKMPRSLPVLVIAGREDPVGSYGLGPQQVAHRLQAAGMEDVTLKLYDGMRHEILNELGCQQVWDDVLAWCEQTLDQAAGQAPAADSMDRAGAAEC